MKPKYFDIDETLHKAMCTFWLHGYEASSLQTLQNVMGIKRQSIYDTFGSKHELFIASLKHYHEEVIKKNFAHMLTADSPLKAIREYFYQRVKDIKNPDIIDGCLVTNTLTELGLSNNEVKKQTRLTLEHMENSFHSAIEKAQELGEIDASKDAKMLATQLLNNAQGLFVMSKSGMGQRKLNQLVDQILSVLD